MWSQTLLRGTQRQDYMQMHAEDCTYDHSEIPSKPNYSLVLYTKKKKKGQKTFIGYASLEHFFL